MPPEPTKETAQSSANDYLFIRHGSSEGDRLITSIDGYPFYRSTGKNSGQPDTFFPFDGLNALFLLLPAYTKPSKTTVVFPLDLQALLDDKSKLQAYDFFRFGNLHCMIISMSIGGGYWNTDDGKKLASFINAHYASDVSKIQTDNKDHFAALKTVKIDNLTRKFSDDNTEKFQIYDEINQALLEKKDQYDKEHSDNNHDGWKFNVQVLKAAMEFRLKELAKLKAPGQQAITTPQPTNPPKPVAQIPQTPSQPSITPPEAWFLSRNQKLPQPLKSQTPQQPQDASDVKNTPSKK